MWSSPLFKEASLCKADRDYYRKTEPIKMQLYKPIPVDTSTTPAARTQVSFKGQGIRAFAVRLRLLVM